MTADTPGQRIKSRRKEIGRYRRSQQALADDVGVTRTTVSSWETDAYAPEGENLRRLATSLGVTTDWILGGDVVTRRPPAFYGGGAADSDARLAETLIQMAENPEVWDWKVGGLRNVPNFLAESIQRATELGAWTASDERTWRAYARGRSARPEVSGKNRRPPGEGAIDAADAAAQHRAPADGERERREG